jgi:predicted flap endonuclease-1-like 5' DNA nuclease
VEKNETSGFKLKLPKEVEIMCCNWKTRLLLIAGLALLWWWLRQPRREEAGWVVQTGGKTSEATPEKPVLLRTAVSTTGFQQYQPPAHDDLTLIYGIGPKIASVLNAAGITTYAQLYETGAAQVREILGAAEIRQAQPETWMEQARLAAGGDLELLNNYQSQSKA